MPWMASLSSGNQRRSRSVVTGALALRASCVPRQDHRSGPVNAALPSRAGEQVWGDDHHLHVRSHLGRGASWGLFGEDLPDIENRVVLSSERTDSSGLPVPELHYQVSENSRRLLDFHIQKASESLTEAGAHTIEVDRLMRYSGWHLLGTARLGTDRATSVVDEWNRAHGRTESVHRGRQLLRDVRGCQPDLHDLRAGLAAWVSGDVGVRAELGGSLGG